MTSICRHAVTSLLQAIAPRKLHRITTQLVREPQAFEFSPDFIADGPDLRTLAERNTQIVEAVKIVRIAGKAQNALEFVIDAAWDKSPDNFPSWNMLEEYFSKIRALPGSAHAFRYLLKNAEQFRQDALTQTGLHVNPDILETKVYGMCNLIAERACFELAVYEFSSIAHKNITYLPKGDQYTPEDIFVRFGYSVEDLTVAQKQMHRPADIYRAYGIALRYATEELGSFVARRALSKLMMASPLPIDELENPDWIDPYTSDLDEDYSYLKVKETAEVSSDGNLPAMIQDLLHNMDDTDADVFQKMLEARGSSLNDYWLQFREAQRSGYSEMPEPEDDREEPEFNVLVRAEEEFKTDLLVDTTEVKKLKRLLAPMLSQIEMFKAQGLKEAQAMWAQMKKFDYDEYHERLLKFPATRQLFYVLSRRHIISLKYSPAQRPSRRSLAPAHGLTPRQIVKGFFNVQKSYEPKTIMGAILSIQNNFGLWEDDLYQIRIPAVLGYTLAHWYAIHGEEFLEQFVTKGDVDYGDKEVNKENGNNFTDPGDLPLTFLDDYARRTAKAQSILYRNGEKKRAYWAQKKGRVYKPDASWHPAFVNAEVETAFLGEGGANSAKSAGWDAYRQSVNPEANAVYHYEIGHGVKHAIANRHFWDTVKAVSYAKKNKIAKIGSQGLTLGSGRVVSWSIALMKLKANEIPLTYEELQRFENHLIKNRWGTKPLLAYLEDRILKEGTALVEK